ncbi:hypothetical protein JR316_0002498 [Psilocybe cubensis]|uniref:Uncharacterized protein n=2 Tax=Psilocybe cubensis TaxID=181762 RepID=A0A8H7Y8T9_PSICU|nr:hypothetical protein JR316_0002498 [Psilocybe cubensis]KAH9485588.1 hypothetical protein JR316_0002498 [Psilocybe cubensis]
MVPAASQALLYSDFEQAALLPGFQSGQEATRRGEDFLQPTRPSSRLGFNRTILSTNSPEAFPDSRAVQWSHSLFQSVGISDLRLSSIKPHLQAKADVKAMEPATLTPVGTGQECQTLNANNPKSQDFVRNSVSRDCIGSPVAPSKSPKGPPPPVSRLCFPFVTTSSRRNKAPPSPPPTRHKYSCFPSPMSPSSTGRSLPKHQRHNYRQHGYSRLALQQIKWFWSTREEDWEGYTMYHHDALPYEGVPPKGNQSLPTSRPSTPPRLLQTDVFSEDLPSLTIHPRRGDISALRDPYCVHIDRCFANVPTWTIGKTIWMHEMHMVTDERNTDFRLSSHEDVSDAESECEFEMSTSTGFSDDSDSTLVESESETDLPNILASKLDIKASNQFESGQLFEGGSSLLIGSHLPCNISNLDVGHWFRTVNVLHAKASPRFTARTKKGRPLNWYRRWELLVELSRGAWDRTHQFFETPAPAPLLEYGLCASNTRRFFLMHKEMDSEDDA